MKVRMIFLLVAAALGMWAQGPPPPDGEHGPPHGHPPGHPPSGLPPGRWWRSPGLTQKLNLSADQQKKMDDVYEQSRGRLIDLSAAVQKEQAALDPILAAEHVDEARAIVQIDRVAAARAELEKANARMLLSLRSALSQEQWRTLQFESHERR